MILICVFLDMWKQPSGIRYFIGSVLYLAAMATACAQAAPAWVATPKAVGTKDETPLSIVSDHMTLKDNEGMTIFEGKVRMQKDDITIEADQAVVFTTVRPSGGEGQSRKREVIKVEATGHVRVWQAGRFAQSEKAVYDRVRNVITLTGHPEAKSEGEGYYIKGEKMIFFLAENRSVVDNGEAVIQP